MSFVAAFIACAVSAVAGGYVEYRVSRAEVKAYAARLVADARAEIRAGLGTITTDIKAFEAKGTVDAKAVIAQFEGRIKQIL